MSRASRNGLLWKGAVAVLLLDLSVAACHGFRYEPDSLVVEEYALDLPKWPKALDGFRIAAVGDIHAGAPFVNEAKLKNIAARVTESKADLIVWLGDYVSHDIPGGSFFEPEKTAKILATARSRYGQVAIIGNHDRWLGVPRIEGAFRAAGIPFLRWESRIIPIEGVRLHLYGLDDFELSPRYWPTLSEKMKQWDTLPAADPLIVLSHNPDVFAFMSARATLTLSAHTHGGQVRLPVFGSLVVPSSFGQRFALGNIVEGGKHLFVNTGIGTSSIPIRFRVPPEISMLTLRAAKASAGKADPAKPKDERP